MLTIKEEFLLGMLHPVDEGTAIVQNVRNYSDSSTGSFSEPDEFSTNILKFFPFFS